MTGRPQLNQKGAETDFVSRAILLVPPLLLPALPVLWTGQRANIGEFILVLTYLIAFGWFCIRDFKDLKLKSKWLVCSPIIIGAAIHFASAAIVEISLNPRRIMTAIEPVVLLAIFSYVPMIVYSVFPRNPKDYLPAIISCIAGSTILAIVGIVVLMTQGSLEATQTILNAHKNNLADTASLGGLGALAFLLTQPKLPWKFRIPFIAVVVITLATCAFCAARACMLSYFAAVFIFLIIRQEPILKKAKRLGALTVASVVILGAMYSVLPQRLINRMTSVEQRSTALARPRLWEMSVNYIQAHPFSPIGMYNMAKDPESDKVIDNPCNFFLQEWIQVGLIGAIGYSIMIFAALFLAISVFRRSSSSKYAFLVAAVALFYQIERFFRDVQDLCEVGHSNNIYQFCAIGMTLFLHLGYKKFDQANIEKMT